MQRDGEVPPARSGRPWRRSAPSRGRARMAVRRYIGAYACLVIIAAVVHQWWPAASSAAVLVIGIASAVAVVIGVRTYHPARPLAWYLLGAAAFVNAVARAVFNVLPGEPGTLKPWAWTVWLLHLFMLLLLAAGAL